MKVPTTKSNYKILYFSYVCGRLAPNRYTKVQNGVLARQSNVTEKSWFKTVEIFNNYTMIEGRSCENVVIEIRGHGLAVCTNFK